MRLYTVLLFLLLSKTMAFGQTNASDSGSTDKVFYAVEQSPAFPGGNEKFMQYLQLAVNTPEAANLLGIDGKVRVSFTVDQSGAIINAKALDTIGYGCEREAIRLVTSSPKWKPGIQNGRAVKVNFTVAIAFFVMKDKIAFKDLNKSHCGFIFNINGKIVSLTVAEAQLGASFAANIIESALPYQDEYNRLGLSNKKEIYLVKIK